jgi:arylsulfatase A-like enzyme
VRLKAEDRPDVVLISMDTLRRDSMAPYGKDLAPTATRLVSGGTAFDGAMATAPWTSPSFASILTGLWPRQHGCREHQRMRGGPKTRSALRADAPLLAEMLARAGYRTVCAQGNFGYLGRATELARGFADYFVWRHDVVRGLGRVREEAWGLAAAVRYGAPGAALTYLSCRVRSALHLPALPAKRPLVYAQALVRRALGRVCTVPAEAPLFLWVNLMDLHVPYCVPRRWLPPATVPVRPMHLHPARVLAGPVEEADRAYIRARYEAGVRYADHWMGRLLEGLDARRLGRPRLTLFLSDHGEEFWDHGHEADDPTYHSRGIDHGHTLFNELLHVPLVVHWPGVVAAGRRVGGVVSLADVTPTLIDLLGLDEDASTMAGRSLAGALTATTPTVDAERVVFADSLLYGPERQAAISATHKLVRQVESGARQLFAWGAGDAAERHNLAADPAHARTLLLLTAALDEWDAELAASAAPTAEARADPALEERLRSLGYM